MKIIVTGGAGFIGSNLVDRLIADNHHVIVLDNLSTGKLSNVHPKANLIKLDLVTVEQGLLNALVDGAEYVFHVAAKARVQPSIADPVLFHEHNVNATLKLLEACRVNKSLVRFIFSSSSSVYGKSDLMPLQENMPKNPISPYAVQKLICEEYCKVYSKVYGIDTVCLRYFNVYGNRQPTEGSYCTILGIFTRQTKNGEPLTITNDGEQMRDFTHVSDIVEANIKAMESKDKFEGLGMNIGYGRSVSINEVANYFGGEKKYIGSVLEPRETRADNCLAKEKMGWVPQVAITPEYVKGVLSGQ